MNKLVCLFAMFMLSAGTYSFADDTCPDGQVMDPDLGVCVCEEGKVMDPDLGVCVPAPATTDEAVDEAPADEVPADTDTE